MKKSRGFSAYEPLDHWLQIRKSFLEAASTYDVFKHPQKIAQKLIWRTRGRLKRWWGTQVKEESMKNILSEPVVYEPQAEKAKDILETLFKLPFLNTREKELLHAVFIQGKSLKEYAKEHPSLSYENIRKIKSRAERRLKAFIKKNPGFKNF